MDSYQRLLKTVALQLPDQPPLELLATDQVVQGELPGSDSQTTRKLEEGNNSEFQDRRYSRVTLSLVTSSCRQFTPAALNIRLEALTASVSAYLSDR